MIVRVGSAIAVILAAALLVVGVVISQKPDNDKAPARYEGLPNLVLPRAGGSMTVFGDSWAGGTGAQPVALGFANQAGFELGLRTTILGVGGSGYLPSANTGVADYPARLRKLPVNRAAQLVVIEGGINDLGRGPVGPAATTTFRLATEKFPNAAILVIGPVSPGIPVNAALTAMSVEIGRAAASVGVYFVSPILQKWVTPTNIGWFINPQINHPTTAGHTYMAERLVSALRSLAKNGQSNSTGA